MNVFPFSCLASLIICVPAPAVFLMSALTKPWLKYYKLMIKHTAGEKLNGNEKQIFALEKSE